jgi:hypothetical protein
MDLSKDFMMPTSASSQKEQKKTNKNNFFMK